MSSVPQSASKWEFLRALGIDRETKSNTDLYGQMKNEASRVYDTTLSRRSNLRPEHANSAAPWSNSQFTDAAIHAAIAQIYADAAPSTKALYRRGTPGGDNWVVKWMLYHVCRYRDSRNKKDKSKDFHDDDDMFEPPRSSASGPSSAAGGKSRVYDAARDLFHS